MFVVGLLIFSFMAVCPGFYFRGHYFIIMLPAVAILGGAGLAVLTLIFQDNAIFPRVVMTIVVGSIAVGFPMYNQRFYLFNLSTDEVCRRVYIGNPFSESLPIAE